MQHSYLKYTLEHSLSHSFEDVLVSCALTWPIFKADFYSEMISAVNSIPASIDTALLHLWYRWQKAEGCQQIRRPLLSLPNNQGNQKSSSFFVSRSWHKHISLKMWKHRTTSIKPFEIVCFYVRIQRPAALLEPSFICAMSQGCQKTARDDQKMEAKNNFLFSERLFYKLISFYFQSKITSWKHKIGSLIQDTTKEVKNSHKGLTFF